MGFWSNDFSILMFLWVSNILDVGPVLIRSADDPIFPETIAYLVQSFLTLLQIYLLKEVYTKHYIGIIDCIINWKWYLKPLNNILIYRVKDV